MPKLIKHGEVVEDTWTAANPDATPSANQICTLEQWIALTNKQGSAVQLSAEEPPAPLMNHLDELALIVIHFDTFMDGRGFSYARELRERGYTGELRASGHFIRDQLTFLQRLGVDSFAMAQEDAMIEAVGSLDDFSQHYQASIDQPEPLFRRR